MKKITQLSLMAILVIGAFTTTIAMAATPSLGVASTFGILSNTYTNTVIGTTINGDVGYTTPPAVMPIINGITYIAPQTNYSQAGTDQGVALLALSAGPYPCTFTFGPGITDLGTDITHGPVGVYEPGVYCTVGAVTAADITLSGAGMFIFRINGAFDMVANTSITLINGASACDVFRTPNAMSTIGANVNFQGTIVGGPGITIGNTVTRIGRALAFGYTVTSDTTTITVPTCITPPVIVVIPPTGGGGGGGGSLVMDDCPNGDYSTGYYDNQCGTAAVTGTIATGVVIIPTIVTGTTITPVVDIVTPIPTTTPTPGFPKTGIIREEKNNSWNIIILINILVLGSLGSIVVLRKERII